MNYRDHIARAVEYMEENLTSELDLDSCARVSGYSKYYFLRVFKEVTDSPLLTTSASGG